MKLKIEDIPTFAGWVDESTSSDDNMLNGYIKDLQSDISGLVMVEDYFSPGKDEEPSEEYVILNECSRRLAYLVSDLKAMRREILAAKLISEAGLKTRIDIEKTIK